MNLILQGFQWIFDPAHWTTTSESAGIRDALAQHLLLTVVSLFFTVLIAVPLGFYIGHSGRGRNIAIISSNVSRAMPTLGLLALLILLFPDFPGLPFGFVPSIVVFVLLGIPSMLAGAYSGLEAVDRQTIDAARAIGMTEWQILIRVEIPLGAGIIVGGLRSTTLQIVATVTVASFYGQVSLGTFLVDGLQQADYVKMTAGAILVAALALIIDGILAIVQRLASPRGVSRGKATTKSTTARGRNHDAAQQGTPIMEGN